MGGKKRPLWSGVFSRTGDLEMNAFNASIGFDQRLYREDIAGSMAYARALKKAGVITALECRRLEKGLQLIQKNIAVGRIKFTDADEDIHMAVEKWLGRYAGEIAGKLHTGRSRNEQVVVDERLYVKNQIGRLSGLLTSLQQVLVDKAAGHMHIIMPGYTHLQQGQLIRLSHYLLALFFMLERDQDRLQDCYKRCDVMPLGSGAIGGNTYALDRKFLARELYFSRISENSIDAVSDRDFIVEFISACAILSMHLSRYCEDLIIWSTTEFGFIELDERFATGSSLMPQKKNPDSLELVRGKTGRVFGHLLSLLTVLKGLPLTYGKDLQEDKEPLFDTVDTVAMAVKIFAGAMATMKINTKELTARMKDSIYATDLVDAYVKKGLPFRTAHQTVGKMIKEGTFSRALGEQKIKNPGRSVDQKNQDGGTSLNSVKSQMTLAKKYLRKKVMQYGTAVRY